MTTISRHHQASDRRHRNSIAATLRRIRLDLGMEQSNVAEELCVTPNAVSCVERGKTADPIVETLQRYARALDHRVVFRLEVGTAVTKIGSHPEATDAQVRCEVVHALAAARRAAGMTQAAVAASMGVHFSAVSIFEASNRGHAPKLGSLQRYARALGGRLTAQIIPAPPVDEVKLKLVEAGRETFGSLTAAEQVALFRQHSGRHAGTDGLRTLGNRWGVSGSRMSQIAALAEAA